tara:strand:+ start:954 stop:1412 length:459 start_codon:yes stop_codon:yes gene_type:complete
VSDISKPILIEKSEAEDRRGSVEFYNNLNFEQFKRFYIVTNPKNRTVRAWHGHKIESKLVKVLKGKFLICTVKIDDWIKPNKNTTVLKTEMNEQSGVFFIPSGFANGAINLEPNSKIIYFSSLHLEESKQDDYRFDSRYWDPWDEYSPEIYE